MLLILYFLLESSFYGYHYNHKWKCQKNHLVFCQSTNIYTSKIRTEQWCNSAKSYTKTYNSLHSETLNCPYRVVHISFCFVERIGSEINGILYVLCTYKSPISCRNGISCEGVLYVLCSSCKYTGNTSSHTQEIPFLQLIGLL
jgi:hypothetical protein